MALLKKDDALEQRLKQIKKEISLVKGDIKSLSNALEGAKDVTSIPALKSSEWRSREEEKNLERALNAEKRLEEARKAVSSTVSSLQRTQVNPLNIAAHKDEHRTLSAMQETGPDKSVAVPVQKQHLDSEKFRDYLSTSFDSSRLLRHERRTQMYKAILMLAVAVVGLIILIYILK